MSKQWDALRRGFFKVFLIGFLGLALSYLCVVVLVMTPIVQTYITYAHHIGSLGNNKFDRPQDYGLAPGKTLNMKLQSSDNVTIGAWFIFADSIHRKAPSVEPPRNPHQSVTSALQTNPTILFLHGNTGTRALPLRITVYTGLTARLDTNVFTIDYRGFGDSEGNPTVEGVAKDARAAWDYLVAQGARPQDVLIVGHSLGTAVATLLTADLNRDGIEPRGLVLMSAFSSLRELMVQYSLLGFLPLLKPLTLIPLASNLLTWALHHRFDNLLLVPDIKASVLLAHGENDWDISYMHSSALFEAFLDPYLSAHGLPENHPPSHNRDDYTLLEGAQKGQPNRNAIVKTTTIPGFGTLEEFTDNRKGGRRVAMLKTHAGGHDIGRFEGVQDVIGRMFGFL